MVVVVVVHAVAATAVAVGGEKTRRVMESVRGGGRRERNGVKN